MSKKLLLAGIITCMVGMIGSMAYAESKEEVNWEKVAEQAPGVKRVTFDKNGQVRSFIAIGNSEIRTVFGAVNGKRRAQRRANLQAKAEIIKWLKEKCSVIDKSKDETVIIDKSAGGKLKTEGKKIEYDSQQIESFAEGIIRGTTVIYSGIKTIQNKQEYRIILGWSAKNTRAAKLVKQMLDSDTVSPDTPKKIVYQGGSSNLLPEESNIADDASEY